MCRGIRERKRKRKASERESEVGANFEFVVDMRSFELCAPGRSSRLVLLL